MKDAQNLVRNGSITFRLVWTLFPPGCPVLGDWKGQKHCFLVHEAKYADAEIQPILILYLLCLDHDGERYGLRRVTMNIGAFAGSMNISALPAVPIHLQDGSVSTLERLRARGAYAEELLSRTPV